MKIDFGMYSGLSADEVFEIDPRYCLNILTNKAFKRIKYAELIQYLQVKVDENPQVLESETLEFGNYCGMRAEDIIHNRNSSKWLLRQEWVAVQYPRVIEQLKELYSIYYLKSPDLNCCYFYVLTFKDADFLKIGITQQENVIRRMYNYLYDYSDYTSYNIHFRESFLYKTNCFEIEKLMLKELKDFRLDSRTERIQKIDLSIVDELIRKTAQNGSFYAFKKNLRELIPFKDGNTWKKHFYVKINEFQDFERQYIQLLWKQKVYKSYNPEFIGFTN
jgi:hypothetical protein